MGGVMYLVSIDGRSCIISSRFTGSREYMQKSECFTSFYFWLGIDGDDNA